MSINNIIFGKSDLHNVVSVEPIDDYLEVFVQDDNGDVKSQFINNWYWILSNYKFDSSWVKLKGGLHYKYGKQVRKIYDYYNTKSSLKDQDFYSVADLRENSLISRGITYFRGLSPKDVSILSFDIETTGTEHNDDSKLLLIANTFRKKNGTLVRKVFAYDEYADEGEMITAWASWVREVDPSILCGHNIIIFDLPYIQFIADKFGVDVNLGRDNSKVKFNKRESQFRVDGNRDQAFLNLRIYGREVCDTYMLAIKHDITNKKYESYGLKNIIRQEGLEDPNRTFYDAATIRFNYKILSEWTKIKAYAKDDGDDALKLYDLMSAPYFYMNQSIPKCFQQMILSASGSQINSLLVRSYLQDGHSIPKADYTTDFQGAISRSSPGIYNNCFKVDVSSLYPSIILQYQLYDKDKDPNANFLKFVEYFTSERLKNKKLASETNDPYYQHLSDAQKILANSGYGFTSSKGLNFNSPKIASFITNKGREILTRAIDWVFENNNVLANCDTDSVAFCKQDQSFIPKDERKQLLDELNGLYPEKIRFADDGYFPKFIVLQTKNYIMLREDGKLTLKGSSLKSSSLEPALKGFIKEMVDSLLNDKKDYVDIYHKYILEAWNITDIKRWVSKKTISSKTLHNERTNEANIREAIVGSEYKEGDRIYVYYNENDELVLVENYDGKYNKSKMLKKVYKATERFWNVLDETQFKDYSLKRKNQDEFKNLLAEWYRNTHQIPFDNKFVEEIKS